MRHAARFALLVAILIASAAAWPAGQVQPPVQGRPPAQGAPQQPAVGTGLIAGQVLDIVTGKPVAETTVQIFGGSSAGAAAGRGLAALSPVITDAQGRFFFANLPPGLYIGRMSKSGYTAATFGEIELADGERVLDARVRLAKLASLSGTLRDEVGDPVVGTDVILARRSVVNGRQTWLPVGRNRSDDRGIYRVGGLQAGDYVVCACTRDPIPFDPVLLSTLGSEPVQLMNVAARALSVGSDVVSLDNTLRTYAPTFYENSGALARAAKITLAPGDDKTGIDMTLQLVHAARVSGSIVGAPGPVQAQSMRLIPEADADAGMTLVTLPPMLVQPDGRFDFATVPPGQYRLLIVHRPNIPLSGPSGAAMGFAGSRGAAPPPAGATMSAGGPALNEPPLWANEPITVGENGVSGMVVTLNRSLAVSGRVQWIGGAPQPPAQMLNRAAVILQPLAPSADPLASAGGGAAGRFSPDATFLIPGALPGKYMIVANALPGFPTLKSVTVGGVDVTDLPFVVGDKDLSDVVITYVDTPMASLTVTTNTAPPGSSTAADDASILVFPVDRKYWAEPAAARQRFRQLALTAKNIATASGLAAGDYFVLFASPLDAADWMESTKLDVLSRRAQRVTLVDGGKASIEVRR